jgi:hypothetical protein
MATLPLGTRPANRFRRLLAGLEPWYDWGLTSVFRLDSLTSNLADEVSGEVHRFEIQWLGIHLGFQIGRTPKREG